MKRIIIAIIMLAAFFASLLMDISISNKMLIGAVLLFCAAIMLTKPNSDSDKE